MKTKAKQKYKNNSKSQNVYSMKQAFDIDTYRNNLTNQIADLTAQMNELAKDRHSNRLEINNLAENIEDLYLLIDPKYVCEYCYSDRHAYQVLRRETEKRMVVRRLTPTRINVGKYMMSDAQDYDFAENPQAPETILRLHNDGFWYEAGNCNPFGITREPHEFFDYSY